MADKMSSDQEAHLQSLKDAFTRLVDSKYRKGQAEHGGNIWDQAVLELVDNAIEENIDQFVFLMTLRDRVVNIIL